MTLQLVVGLCNPGPEYQSTRHNAGAWFIDELLTAYSTSLKPDKKLQGSLAKLPVGSKHCYAFTPSHFMNINGQSIQAVMQYFQIPPAAVLIAHDDLDLPAGTIKLKFGGGTGGHNGLKSVLQHLHTPDFYRLKIGIGHPRERPKVHDYVLGAPSLADQKEITAAIERAVSCFPLMLQGEWAQAMQALHTLQGS